MDLDRDIDIIKLRLNKAYGEKVYWRNVIPISVLGVVFMWFFFLKIGESMSASIENVGIVVCVAFSVIPFMCKNKMEECQSEFADLYKFYLSRIALEKYFYDIEYDVSNAMGIEDFFSTKIISSKYLFGYSSEDYFRAKYEGLQIEQTDVRIESPYIVDKYRKVIDGRFTILKFEKDIWSDIVIVSKHCSKAVIEGMKKVELEDIEFNECFDVYTKNSHSVFYLLTPQFMRYILMLDTKYPELIMRFDGEYLYLLRSGIGGVFHVSRNMKHVDEDIERNCADMKEVVDLIEILKLVKKDKMNE